MSNPRDDQIGAAVHHAQWALGEVKDMIGAVPAPADAAAGPVHDLLAAWRERDAAGGLRGRCKHLGSPQPIFGYLALVGDVWCARCMQGSGARAYAAAVASDECDACGTRSRRFSELTYTLGPVILSANVCGSCRALAYPDAPRPTAGQRAQHDRARVALESSGRCPWCRGTGEPKVNPLTGTVVVNIAHDPGCPVMVYGRDADGNPRIPD